MNPLSSLRGLAHVLRRDARVARIGPGLGWYTLAHYRNRLAARTGRPVNDTSVRVTVHGRPAEVHLNPAGLAAFYGVFVEHEYDLTATLPGFAPATVLDIGANMGMGTAYLAARYPAARFVCVEPDPRNLPLLRKTLTANSVPAVVVPAAVAAKPGTLRLRFGADPTCSALETSPMHDLSDGVDVPVRTVPDVLSEAGWDRVDLLKLDIEGTEQELLGQENGWLERVGAIVLEIHPNTTPEEIGGFLRPFGFSLARLGSGFEPVYLATRGGAAGSAGGRA